MFGISEKTISRTLKGLEENGFIKRVTKNIKGGKERHMSLNLSKFEENSTTDKMSLEDAQETKCPLSTDNLSIDNRQNDLIKDKLKDKEKDNLGASLAPIVAEKAPEVIPEGEVKEMAFEEFKKEFANDLCVADTSQF
jgi:DNA-binding Lrp family transcriptional regulator